MSKFHLRLNGLCIILTGFLWMGLQTKSWAEDPATSKPQNSGVHAAESKAVKKKAPFAINIFQHQNAAGWYINTTQGPKNVKFFKIGFKIEDDSINSLDVGRIYLYNDKKELIQTFSESEIDANKLVGIPNLLTSLVGLKKGPSYHIAFHYPEGEIKWKYAVAIIGNSDVVVGKTIPTMVKVEEFDFPEKARLLK